MTDFLKDVLYPLVFVRDDILGSETPIVNSPTITLTPSQEEEHCGSCAVRLAGSRIAASLTLSLQNRNAEDSPTLLTIDTTLQDSSADRRLGPFLTDTLQQVMTALAIEDNLRRLPSAETLEVHYNLSLVVAEHGGPLVACALTTLLRLLLSATVPEDILAPDPTRRHSLLCDPQRLQLARPVSVAYIHRGDQPLALVVNPTDQQKRVSDGFLTACIDTASDAVYYMDGCPPAGVFELLSSIPL